jgi:hypothetical protein
LGLIDSLIPVAIVGATHFYATFVQILSKFSHSCFEDITSVSFHTRYTHTFSLCDDLYNDSLIFSLEGFIGYWVSPFLGIVLTEHFVFRRGSWTEYRPAQACNKHHHPNLAKGYAAVFTFLTSIPIIAMCMSLEWWTGPVAKAGTGDIAIIVSFAYSVVMFWVTRALEKKLWK